MRLGIILKSALSNAVMALGVLCVVIILFGGFQLENIMRGLWRLSESYVNGDPDKKASFKSVLSVIYGVIFIFVCFVSSAPFLQRKWRERSGKQEVSA